MNTEQALNEIGERLKRYRLNRNLSQKEIAERAGIGLASVARLEDGKGSNWRNSMARNAGKHQRNHELNNLGKCIYLGLIRRNSRMGFGHACRLF